MAALLSGRSVKIVGFYMRQGNTFSTVILDSGDKDDINDLAVSYPLSQWMRACVRAGGG
jgi:hypothetical protein